VSGFAHRFAAGLHSCWLMRGSAYPRGTYLALFLAAWWFVCRSWRETGRVNVMDLFWALGTGLLMVLAFAEGFRAVPGPADSECSGPAS
jgi:hypothetical protein